MVCTGTRSGRCCYFLQTGSAVLSCRCSDCSCSHPAWSYQSGAGTLAQSLARDSCLWIFIAPSNVNLFFFPPTVPRFQEVSARVAPRLFFCSWPLDEQPRALPTPRGTRQIKRWLRWALGEPWNGQGLFYG